MNSHDRILAHLKGDPIDRLPVMPITMMFAADHIGVKYGDYARDHRILAEAQLRTAEDFGFDQVSVISDPAREAADCGAKIRWFEDQPPSIDENQALLSDKGRLASLDLPNPLGGGRMTDRIDAVRLLKKEVGDRKWVEGWVEGPIAQAADLRGINHVMLDLYEDPDFVRELLDRVVALEIEFARAQIEAGADGVGLGDAAASLVGPKFYREVIQPAETKLVVAIQSMGVPVRLHICGRTTHHLEGMRDLHCGIVDLDWMVDMGAARAAMGPEQVLLGNIDPVRIVRNGSTEQVREGLAHCHAAAGPRYIVGAGCEIPRDSPRENVRMFREFAESVALGV